MHTRPCSPHCRRERKPGMRHACTPILHPKLINRTREHPAHPPSISVAALPLLTSQSWAVHRQEHWPPHTLTPLQVLCVATLDALPHGQRRLHKRIEQTRAQQVWRRMGGIGFVRWEAMTVAGQQGPAAQPPTHAPHHQARGPSRLSPVSRLHTKQTPSHGARHSHRMRRTSPAPPS